jgi:hypothetical protein
LLPKTLEHRRKIVAEIGNRQPFFQREFNENKAAIRSELGWQLIVARYGTKRGAIVSKWHGSVYLRGINVQGPGFLSR